MIWARQPCGDRFDSVRVPRTACAWPSARGAATSCASFLIEFVLVCLVGGAAGIALALGGGHLRTLLAGTPLTYSMLSIVLAFASCSPIVVGFAFMPARAASRLDPLAALARH